MCAQITTFPIETQPISSVVLLKADNLSGLANTSAARSNLGLGSLATQSGTFSGTSSGTNTGDQTTITGNAGTATALQTARTINGVSFNGTANVTVPAAGSTLTDTVPVVKGGTGLTALGTALQVLRTNASATAAEWGTVSGSGDVVGPASATASRLALFDGTTGKLLKDSSTITVSGGTITASGEFGIAAGGTNQNVVITPTGTGIVSISAPLNVNASITGGRVAYFRTNALSQPNAQFVLDSPSGNNSGLVLQEDNSDRFGIFYNAATSVGPRMADTWELYSFISANPVVRVHQSAGNSFNISSSGAIQFATYGAGTLTTDGSGNVTASSDERLKNIDGDFKRGLAELRLISPKLYHWRDDSGLDSHTQYAGLIAQDVQAAIPEAVGTNMNGMLSLSDRPIISALINAVKELEDRIVKLGG